MRPEVVIFAALTASACATHHQARGLVLRVDRDARMVTVSHEQVPGFMDAMVMPFELRDPSELTDLVAGDRIAFRIASRRPPAPARSCPVPRPPFVSGIRSLTSA